MPRQHILYQYNGEELSWCRYGCGRQIYFVSTGRSLMPVDFETKETHFAHCLKYAELRNQKRKKKETPCPPQT